MRDANFKRDAAIRRTSGDLIALVTQRHRAPARLIGPGVTALEDSGTLCVTGGMKSVHDSFWGPYTDSTFIGVKRGAASIVHRYQREFSAYAGISRR